MQNKRSPNPVDVHVGSRLRIRRMVLGMSQEKLGESLGVSFQQVQKYEKGTNRIGAGRLQNLSQILQVPIAYFYEDLADEGAHEASGFADSGAKFMTEMLTTSDGLEMTRSFLKIQDPKVRKRIVDLVRAIADGQQD
ncbi:MAG: helix-turn-helix transcriptional regulator [Pseudomonadota bacterium]